MFTIFNGETLKGIFSIQDFMYPLHNKFMKCINHIYLNYLIYKFCNFVILSAVDFY